LRATDPFTDTAALVGAWAIVPRTAESLPSALPYNVRSSHTYSEIPSSEKYGLRIQLPGIDYDEVLPDIAGQRVTIFYEGATPADVAAIEANGGIYFSSNAYQINMKPVLRVDGVAVAEGSPLTLGTTEEINITITRPLGDGSTRTHTLRQTLTAGEWYALPVRLQFVSSVALAHQNERLEEVLASGISPDSEPLLGQALHVLGLAYYNQVGLGDQLAAQLAQVLDIRHFAVMIASQTVTVWWADVDGELRPWRIDIGGFGVDVGLDLVGAESWDGDDDRRRAFLLMGGLRGSAVEHAILQQLQHVEAYSTIELLDRSNSLQGDKLLHFTPANYNRVADMLDYGRYNGNFQTWIQSYLRNGEEVIIPHRRVYYPSPANATAAATGWIDYDPDTGVGGYIIVGLSPAGLQQGGSIWGSRRYSIGPGAALVDTNANPPSRSQAGSSRLVNFLRRIKDPVDIGTGDFWHTVRDLELAGRGVPLVLDRAYTTARHARAGALGYGWTHTYAMRLDVTSDWGSGVGGSTAQLATSAIAAGTVLFDVLLSANSNPELHQAISIGALIADWDLAQQTDNARTLAGPDGATYVFHRLADGTYAPPAGLHATLTEGDGAYTLIGKDHTRLRFNWDGRLTTVQDNSVNATTLSYDVEGRLDRVTDATNRALIFTYDAANRITRVTDPASRTVRFAYSSAGDLVAGTDVRNKTTRYTYDDAHRLLTITDPEGTVYVNNAYDAVGDIFTQTNGRETTTQLRYAWVRTVVTDALGVRTTYRFDPAGRLTKIQNSLGGVTQLTYRSPWQPALVHRSPRKPIYVQLRCPRQPAGS